MAKTDEVVKAPQVPSRQALYSRMAVYAPEAIATLYDLMKTATNDSVRISAANKIIDKCLPDIKAVEMTGQEGSELLIKIVSESKNG